MKPEIGLMCFEQRPSSAFWKIDQFVVRFAGSGVRDGEDEPEDLRAEPKDAQDTDAEPEERPARHHHVLHRQTGARRP